MQTSSHNQSSRGIGKAFEEISPSAWGTAYQRTLTDIPLSNEVFDILNTLARQTHSVEEIARLELWRYPQLTPMFEARFKLVGLLLRQNHADQVLEIAAGFSTRGIEMTKASGITYVEMDLPCAISEKKFVLESLQAQSTIAPRPNLHLEEGDALITENVSSAARWFKKKPVTVVNEGLLRYLNLEEKTVVARNIHHLLREFGGMWITPDVSAKGMNALGPLKSIVRQQNEQMRLLTGIDVRKNYFQNEDGARAFFESMGFAIERHPFTEVITTLVSPQNERLSEEQVIDSIGTSAVYVMKPF